MPLTALDHLRLAEALQLAESSVGLSEPNPRVGCVVGHDDGRVLGRGFTQQAGGPHAEIVALQAARDAGTPVAGATAWVTLEPCAHHGRTPPCCDALVAAGIARVVVAVGDPFPQVDGAGVARLRAAGVAVDLAPPAIARAARELNIGFFSRVLRQRPWVRMKSAISLDGRSALADGTSRWITGPAARADGHAWRRRAAAILTGVGTVLDDDPRLDVREVQVARQPALAVVDSGLRTPPGARLFEPAERPVWLYAANVRGTADVAARVEGLRARGAEIRVLPGAFGRVDLPALMHDLAGRGVNELHVEAGFTLGGALLAAGLVDELLVYVAPRLLGPGRPLAELPALARLEDAPAWRYADVQPLGDDLRLLLRRAGADDFAAGSSAAG
jgi:diaminohydroxyphosphoribosylaminopyrimidine deaminase/5-amino-6-(5-phosphoribosylamino)uracil reductase